MSDREPEDSVPETTEREPSRSARLLAMATDEPVRRFESDAQMPHPEELTWVPADES